MPKEKRELNVDIPKAINDLQSMMKAFRLKEEIFRILFRGKGLEFEGFRDFSPDDDASDIDWKTSSRAMKLLVKQYKEERDLKIMFVVDVGSNMVFGSTDKLKCEYATELIAALSYLIVKQNDKIGFFLFSDSVSNYVDCRGGEKHFHFFVDTLKNAFNYGGKTDLDQALDFAMEYFNNSISSVIVISDFLNITNESEKKLELLSNMFETVFIKIKDPLDLTLPDMQGEVILEDSVSNDQILINPRVAKSAYERYALEQDKIIEEMFTKTQADSLNLLTNKNFAEPLAIFLKERGAKL